MPLWFLMPHILAATLVVVWVGFVSTTGLFQTGIQFVTPVILVALIHLIWLQLTGGVRPGFATRVFARTSQTAALLVGVLMALSVFGPTPAQADVGEFLGAGLGLVFCVAVIAVVILILGLFVKLVLQGIDALLIKIRGGSDPDSRMFDAASFGVAVVLLSGASLEGTTPALTLPASLAPSTTVTIPASPAQVWTTMRTTASPSLPVPALMHILPQPTAVVVDEGMALGANRRVRFDGREGSGHLHLRVMDRTDTSAVFHVVSDTTPLADWVTFKTLTYTVAPHPEGTALTVALGMDRSLAPAWFFGPVMGGAGRLATGVLAHDIQTRATP